MKYYFNEVKKANSCSQITSIQLCCVKQTVRVKQESNMHTSNLDAARHRTGIVDQHSSQPYHISQGNTYYIINVFVLGRIQLLLYVDRGDVRVAPSQL